MHLTPQDIKRLPKDVAKPFLKHLYETGMGSDITFLACGVIVRAHKSVLAAKSAVWKRNLEKDNHVHSYISLGSQSDESSSGQLEFSTAVFKALLGFCYTGDYLVKPSSYPNANRFECWDTTVKFLSTVLGLAEKSEILDLVQYCTAEFKNAARNFFQTRDEATVLEIVKDCYNPKPDGDSYSEYVLVRSAALLEFRRRIEGFQRSGEHAKAVAWMDEVPAATADLFKQTSEMQEPEACEQQSGICGKSFMQALGEVSEALLASTTAT